MTRSLMLNQRMITKRMISRSQLYPDKCILVYSRTNFSNSQSKCPRSLRFLSLILMFWLVKKMMEKVPNSPTQSPKFSLAVLISNYPRPILCNISSSTVRSNLQSFSRTSIRVNLEDLDSCSSKTRPLLKILSTINVTLISLGAKLI